MTSALEVGVNVGGNLEHVARSIGAAGCAGVDINEGALATARGRIPGADLRLAAADALPFADGSFELTFTMAVLIHLPAGVLEQAMAEVVRCSSRYVLCGEYHAEEPTEVHYRGHDGALFKRDWGALYRELHPGPRLLDTGFLPKDERAAWDDVTWWLFERS